MTARSQTIWKAFCGELTQEPTDDMREALATALREVAHNNEVKYHQGDCVVDLVFYADELYELADELEKL